MEILGRNQGRHGEFSNPQAWLLGYGCPIGLTSEVRCQRLEEAELREPKMGNAKGRKEYAESTENSAELCDTIYGLVKETGFY